MKNRKSIIALLLVAIIGIVGLTVAYFSNSTSITNEFETSEYGTDVIETFTSPTGWQPGDETPKVLTVKNTGEVDEAVRIKVEEKWVNKNGEELPLTQDGNVAAQINYINEDDWTKVEVANEDYYYYYYNYKLAPEEETSELLDKVTFNPLINASTTCTDSTGENGETIRSCKSNGSGYDGATYTLKFTIETVQYNKYQEAWNVDVAIAEEKPHPGTLTLLEKTNPVSVTNYTDGNIHEMYTFEHEETAQTPAQTDYRYIGNDPYNYVYFNCDEPQEGIEYNYSTSCEVWRIIGVFDVEREVDDEENPGEKKTIIETRMKLVSNNITNRYWNSTKNNDWTGATLNSFLNDSYINRTGAATNYGLKSSARELIDNSTFYLGAILWGTAESMYHYERSNVLCESCNSYNQLKWYGKIGLLYPSDYYTTYAKGVNSTCYDYSTDCSEGSAKFSWLYNNTVVWLISPISPNYSGNRHSTNVFNVERKGNPVASPATNNNAVRPVVYLSSSVQIFDGDGSEGNPYKLKK